MNQARFDELVGSEMVWVSQISEPLSLTLSLVALRAKGLLPQSRVRGAKARGTCRQRRKRQMRLNFWTADRSITSRGEDGRLRRISSIRWSKNIKNAEIRENMKEFDS